MFIPINIQKKDYQSGDKVILVKNIPCGYVMFTIGHELVVVEKVKNYSYYRLMDEETNTIIRKADPSEFTFKTSLQEAKQIYVDIKEKEKTIKFIQDNCPNRGKDSWDRDEYDSCKLIKNHSFSNNECYCKLSCINYIDRSIINKNSFIKVYMRRLKINKLKTE